MEYDEILQKIIVTLNENIDELSEKIHKNVVLFKEHLNELVILCFCA